MNPSILPRLARFAGLAAAAVAIAGCSLSRPDPVKATFLLEPALPAAVAVAARAPSLKVNVVTVAAPFRDRAFVYRVGELRYESDFYHTFFAPPGVNIAETAARSLSAAGVFERVQPPGTGAGELVLDGFVSALYVDARDASAPVAELAVTWYLSRTDEPPGAVRWSKSYGRREPLGGTGAEAAAQAWNRALTSMLAELARDLATGLR
jgi:uncharacterized lipoprotein YmbA